MKRLIVALAVLVGLTACDHPESGTVLNKSYTAGYYYTTQTCVARGKYGCSAYAPQLQWVPPEWRMCVRPSGQSSGSSCFDVTQAEYDSVPIGGYFNRQH